MSGFVQLSYKSGLFGLRQEHETPSSVSSYQLRGEASALMKVKESGRLGMRKTLT